MTAQIRSVVASFVLCYCLPHAGCHSWRPVCDIMNKRSVLGLVTVLLLLMFGGCRPTEDVDGELSVWVTIQPQKYFVERIAGGEVAVEVLVRPGQSPELYAPSAAQMARLARADVYFGIGVPVEATIFPRIRRSMPAVRLVGTGPIDPILAFSHDHHDHHNHDHHDHGHGEGEVDPHVWVDPVEMVTVVKQIRDGLIQVNPRGSAEYEANAEALIAELEQLHTELTKLFAPHTGKAFYINHPSLGYLARRYALNQVSIEQAGTDPSSRRIAELIAEIRSSGVSAIFKQPEFGRSSAAVLADALDIPVVEVNPLAEDYINNMRNMAQALERSFSK